MTEYTTLGNLISPAKVIRCGNGSYPVLSMTMHDGIVLQSDRFKKSLASADQSDYKVVKYGQLVVGFPIDEGVLYIQKATNEGIMSPAYNVWDVDTLKVEADYLELCLHSPQAMQYYCDKLRGSTARRRSIPTADLLALPIRLPTLEEQREKLEMMAKMNALIADRHQQLDLTDQLVKSRFIEMFGDPASNPFKWSTLTMKQASNRLSDGPFGSNLKSEHYTLEGVRVIRLGNIGCGYFNDDDQSYISQEHYATIKKYTCRAGEIVIATLGDPNLRACIIPDHIEYGVNKSDCVHYIPKAEILNNQFVCQYINCPETLSLASGMVHGQTRSRISSGQLADLPIYLPPMDLQQQFADFVEQIDKSKYHGETTCEMEVAA